MSLPYYKRFPRDFLDATIGLSLEEKGAYSIVLDLIYMRSGSLEDDPRYISGQLGCSVRKWTAIRDALITKGKLQVDGGIISNFRADYLLEETRKYQDKQSETATKPRKNKNLRQPKPSQSDTDTEVEDTAAVSAHELPADDWPIGDAPSHAATLIDEAATVRLDMARQPGLVLTLGRLPAWRAAGASWEFDIIPVVKTLARKQGPPIQSWKFFDAAVAQSIAENRKALEIPDARPSNVRSDHHPNARQAAFAERLADVGAAMDEAARRVG